MINDQSNMSRKHIFDELPVPSTKGFIPTLSIIYKGIFIIIKLLLDIRLNMVKISQGKKIVTKHEKGFKKKEQKPDNPIKGLDNIKVDPKKMETIEKGAILTEGKTKTGVKEAKNTPPPVHPPDGGKNQ